MASPNSCSWDRSFCFGRFIRMLAWLDFDSDAMKRAHELLQQFRDARTVDHLRLGGVRDDFANYFFPATSTIMPHARYLILVPRAFLQLEAEIRQKGYSL